VASLNIDMYGDRYQPQLWCSLKEEPGLWSKVEQPQPVLRSVQYGDYYGLGGGVLNRTGCLAPKIL
jgi:hypothetical protein